MNKLHYGYIKTNKIQRLILNIGAGIECLRDPTRDDLVATLGETMGHTSLKYIKNRMMSSEEGREILKQKPIINSSTINFNKLISLPSDTLGKCYAEWYLKNNVSPDTRKPVYFIDDIELGYIVQRYRETHDLLHTLLGMPTNLLGEVSVKWIEAIQTGLPMCIFAALFGPLRFTKKQREKYLNYYLNWAIKCGYNAKFLLATYYEKYWETNIYDFRKQLNIIEPPNI